MSSFTTWHRTYSESSSSLSSSTDVHNVNPKDIFIQPSKSSPRTIHRHSFLIRVVIFVLLELCYITLVSVALRRPIMLDLSFTIAEVKSVLTAIAILWHSLAVFAVKDILLNIFSAEWIEQYDGSHSLTHQELDGVSRLTTGFIDQFKHCVSRRATHPFRLGFLSSLLLILLTGFGPSAIGVDLASYEHSHTVQVANLTIGSPESSGGGTSLTIAMLVTPRVNAIVQLEVIENSTSLGFTATQPNMLIPWPSSNPIPKNKSIRYQSDVIRYNFSCSWEVPSPTETASAWMVGNDEWQTYLPLQWHFFNRYVYPLVKSAPDGYSVDTTPLMAFLFIGMNTSSGLNIEDTPSLVVPSSLTQNPTYWDGNVIGHDPWVVSVLMCDPQFEILHATVNATASSLTATILSGERKVKNIPVEAANYIFSRSLLDPISEVKSTVCDRLFFPSSFYEIEDDKGAIHPLSLTEINQNMSKVLASSAKAYLSGYKPDDNNILLPSFATMDTPGVIEVQKMAMVGSGPFFVALSVTVGLLVALLGALVMITRPDRLESFDLENIVKKLPLNY